MTKTKRSLIFSIVSLILCLVMLTGSTFAWFTDSITSGKNVIVAGNLDVELEYLNADGKWESVEGKTDLFDQNALWEPGHTETVYLRVVNLGSLALKYKLGLNIADEIGSMNVLDKEFKLSDFIRFGAVNDVEAPYADRAAARDAVKEATLIREGFTTANSINAGDPAQYVVLVVYMPETVGNEANYKTGCAVPKIELGVTLVATQMTDESDSFGNTYDEKAEFPEMKEFDVVVDVPVENGVTTQQTTANGEGYSVIVPAGVKTENNSGKLGVSVTEKESSDTNLQLSDNEIMRPLDVHVDGVAADNTKAIIINLGEVAPKGLNIGNYTLYHVENGTNVAMTSVASNELDAHNEFYYDPATGEITVAMATFSEVAVVADTEAKWEGNRDYSWYTNAVAPADSEATTEYVIANADQLAGFGAIVGGMDGQTQDSFSGKTVKLIADINLGDKESKNNPDIIFYPIGYWNNEGTYERKPVEERTTEVESGFYSFCGTFDGNGNTVSNFYQNTWEMKGDHNWYDVTLQYYRDGMGLFGKVYGGTVKNLTVNNFSSDGEITTTGVIAAYAEGATFENIAITDCNPRVYNIGNGGIVGCVGWYAKEAGLKTTFKNITVDNSNKISALWGSYDVACGGIVGQYYPTSGQTSAGTLKNGGIEFVNCHVAAQMDVYNDVCANYQYYAYRYTGMMIGSVRENETIDGHVYPKMDGITASGCTVHFGDWNDYYYCEIVANSLASYTHDHQFSRLEQVTAINGTTITYLDGTTGTVPTSGWAHYVVVSGAHASENATCYHFKDGNVWNHEDAGTETVNGQTVLKEDKQHIYLEFNNLFTGYGWGVTSKGVGDLAGVTILDREYANSVEKFEKANTAKDSYTTETTVTIGELFAATTINDSKLTIKPENVQVTVSPAYGTNSTAGATYTANTTDWTQGTLTFSGLGAAKITITDYYFCIPTTIQITVAEPDSVDKFDLVFENTDDYLYRVGNANAVALGKLFKAKEGVEIGNVTVTVTALNDAVVSGVYTENASDWTKGTIQFSGTGPVLVTIDDDAYANEKALYLEVVNATNVTAYSELKSQNSVLLNDITMSSGGTYALQGATLYGNGFTFDVTDGEYAAGGNISSNYVVYLSNASLDNVKIIGAVYTAYGATVSDDYNRPVVLSVGNNTITNCYISNCAAPVRVKDGNLEIINSTLKGGNFANLDIRNGHVILDNVTTINQVNGNDTAKDGTVVVGFGVVVYYENVLNTTTVEIKNGITQYNHLSESQANDYIKDSYAKQLTSEMFKETYSAVQYYDGTDTWVNTGILSMTSEVGNANITDVDGYAEASPSMMGTTGYLHAKKPDATSIAAAVPEYVTAGQGTIAPSYSFDYTTKNYQAKTDGSNDYCYEENGTVNISMDAGDIFNWDTSILTATKNGQTLSYTVSMNGTDYTGKSIMFNTTGNYEVVYTYTDTNNYGVDAEGNITTYSKTYTKKVHISVAAVEPDAKNAKFTFGSSNTASTKVTVGNNTYVMPNVSATSSTIGSTTVDGTTIYYPIVEIVMSDSTTSHTSAWYAYFPVFSGAVTITDYAEAGIGDEVTYDSSTTSMPSGLNVVGDPSSLFKYQSSSSAGTTPVVKNNILVYSSPSISKERSEYNTVIQYSYKDNSGQTCYYYIGYHAPAQSYSSCVTGDTLVTLADGTQKRIDQVTYADQLLAWDFYTGTYAAVPAAIIFDHGYDNNTVIALTFSDGTVVKVVNMHQFLDADLNEFVTINADNVAQYVGHQFVKQNGDGYSTVTLVDYAVSEEYIEAYGIISALHYNIFVEGMLSTDFMPQDYDLFNYFEIGDDMMYDQAAMQADIEKYGLYTYEEFADYLTYEQFVAFNVQYMKVAVGKGTYTYEGILALIDFYLNQ